MKTIEIYDEYLMKTSHVVISHIVSLRQTDEEHTVLSLTNSSSILTKKPLDVVLKMIKDA